MQYSFNIQRFYTNHISKFSNITAMNVSLIDLIPRAGSPLVLAADVLTQIHVRLKFLNKRTVVSYENNPELAFFGIHDFPQIFGHGKFLTFVQVNFYGVVVLIRKRQHSMCTCND